ncbi:polysaccharide pyruvyl transferase family protein [Herbiconiux sp. P18]|uniref:polysaccharide pyruvyl transferase family protein n=1 Tax=Herbiconiux liangxiaofengii TaxID=3342795 RepID=UPI0035BB085C
MRLVLLGDVGVLDDMIHIGDEAMFDEALHQLRQRGATQVTAVSANPAETAERYGVESVARIGFSAGAAHDRAADGERMRRVVQTARGESGLLAAGDPAFSVIEAVRAADGVLVTGGGNMASTWPLHVFERATLGAVAEALGRPLVVSGQTIGPELGDDDARLVTELLSSARRVGLREPASFALCRRLGVPDEVLHATVDDASFVGDRVPAAPGSAGPVGRDYCAVTFSTHLNGRDPDAFVRAAAALLDDIADRGLDVLFVAHFGSLVPGAVRGDSVLHDRVAASMRHPSTAVVPGDSVSAAALVAREAALVLTSRYHPAVFAVSGGVPTIGISVDDYTTVKLTGALGNLGQDAVLPLDDLLGAHGGAAAALLDRVWSDRGRIRMAGLDRAQAARADSARWWDDVAAALAPTR